MQNVKIGDHVIIQFSGQVIDPGDECGLIGVLTHDGEKLYTKESLIKFVNTHPVLLKEKYHGHSYNIQPKKP